MPRECLVCGGTLTLRERHLCLRCLCDLPLTFNWNMAHNGMADRLNALMRRDLPCEPYAYAAALFTYSATSAYSAVTKSLKYHGNLSGGRWFSAVFGERLASSPLFADVDVVIPVPLHWARRWRRGYNQAEVIAREVAAKLGAVTLPDALRRHRRTKSQTHLDIQRKAANVSGAFRLSRKYTRNPQRLLRAVHILLVDDVFTTGATIHECYKTLREVVPPVTRISAATLAAV